MSKSLENPWEVRRPSKDLSEIEALEFMINEFVRQHSMDQRSFGEDKTLKRNVEKLGSEIKEKAAEYRSRIGVKEVPVEYNRKDVDPWTVIKVQNNPDVVSSFIFSVKERMRQYSIYARNAGFSRDNLNEATRIVESEAKALSGLIGKAEKVLKKKDTSLGV